LAEASQSRRGILAAIAVLIVIVGAFILLRPHLWVKNKTAKVIVDGRLSEDVKLYHGSDGRILFYLKSDPHGFYYHDVNTGIFFCFNDSHSFLPLKLVVLSREAMPRCADFYGEGKLSNQSLEFHNRNADGTPGQDVIVSWQAAPR
jgi:hypothetical protein